MSCRQARGTTYCGVWPRRRCTDAGNEPAARITVRATRSLKVGEVVMGLPRTRNRWSHQRNPNIGQVARLAVVLRRWVRRSALSSSTMTARSHYARGRDRREALVTAAVAVIAARGIEGVTFRSVAAQAGVPASTTSYFFGTVDDVIEAAVRHVADVVVTRVEEVMTRADAEAFSADELADALVRLVADTDHDDTIAQFETYLAVRRRPALAPVVEQISTALSAACVTALRAFGVADPAAEAPAFVALIDGFALHRMAGVPTEEHHLRAALFALLDSCRR